MTKTVTRSRGISEPRASLPHAGPDGRGATSPPPLHQKFISVNLPVRHNKRDFETCAWRVIHEAWDQIKPSEENKKENKRDGAPSFQDEIYKAFDTILAEDLLQDTPQTLTWWLQSINDRVKRQSGKRLHPQTIKKHVKQAMRSRLTIDQVPRRILTPADREGYRQLQILRTVWAHHSKQLMRYLGSLPQGTLLKDIKLPPLPPKLAQSMANEWNSLANSSLFNLPRR